jgi:hypothetical protein
MRKVIEMLFLALAFSSVEGFTTKKKERRSHFSPTSQPKEQPHEHISLYSSEKTGFASRPGTIQGQVIQHYDTPDDDEDVSYGVALVSCMLSLAVGFGLGYGT